jgi:hypothetical protein
LLEGGGDAYMAMLPFMWNTALIAGALAAGYWFLRGQSIHKGFGFTFHWWAPVDLLAGARQHRTAGIPDQGVRQPSPTADAGS